MTAFFLDLSCKKHTIRSLIATHSSGHMSSPAPYLHPPSKSSRTIIHDRNQVLRRYIGGLRIKDKRLIFTCMERDAALTHNTFLPHYGFRVGEFAVHYILGDKTQRSRRLKRNQVKLQQRTTAGTQ